MCMSSLKNLLMTGLILSAPTASASSFDYLGALKYMYEIYFGSDLIWKIDETGSAYPSNPRWGDKIYENNLSYLDTGILGYEPTFQELYNSSMFYTNASWSSQHTNICAGTNAHKELPIRNYQSDPTKLIVNQGVPFSFRAKSHGGLTKQMTKSFYFWNFGDGIRRFNKKSHNEYASHVYNFLGSYTLSSIVYSTELRIGISFGGTLDGDFGFNMSPIKPIIDSGKTLYLESCDSMPVKVVTNNAPTARINETNRSVSVANTAVTFSAASSSDPDGNPLTYTWKRNGVVVSSAQRATISFSNPEYGTQSYTVSLTVSDGGKSHSTNKTVHIGTYCYACNGFEIP